MYDFKGKVAIVTGSGRPKGLGEAMARRFAAEGAAVVIHDIGQVKGEIAPEHGVGKAAEMEAIAKSINGDGGKAATFAGDMLVEKDVENLVAFAVEKFGRLDFFVNNAGIGYLFGPLVDMTQEHWDAVLGVNLRGAFFGIKHAARQMIKQGEGGSIVNIASQAAKGGSARTAAYTSSKHGMVGLTRVAATELAAHQIRVNALCPNHVTTGLGSWQNDYMSKSRGLSLDDYLADRRSRIPLDRLGFVEDTAKACAFLCSEQASYVTGEAMNVSGGEQYH